MTCDELRAVSPTETLSAKALVHLRDCDDCLEWAAAVDPMNLFRAIGGNDVPPPGGVEAFVGDVMREVRLRDTAGRVDVPRRHPLAPWTIAAAIMMAVTSAVFVFRPGPAPTPRDVAVRAVSLPGPPQPEPIVPVVEKWAAAGATIVEVPTLPEDDIRVVMIFDESLPVDL